jgi:hypothetical protein
MVEEAVGSVTAGRLRELAALFLRLGTTAFGGPAAHIAMVRDEVVTSRKWLTLDDFLDLLGVRNMVRHKIKCPWSVLGSSFVGLIMNGLR